MSMEEKTTEELAQLYLQSFLNDTDDNRYIYWLQLNVEGPRDHQHLFYMLEKHPHLAKKRFAGGSLYESFPLSYLLAAHAPLEMIEKVHKMNPDAIRTRANFRSYPLYEAVVYGCSFDVIKFLLEKYPQAAKAICEGDFPINHLDYYIRNAGRKRNFDGEEFSRIVQLLYNAHPPSQGGDIAEAWPRGLASLICDELGKVPASLLRWLAKGEKPVCKLSLDRLRQTTTLFCQNLKHFVNKLECETLCLTGGDERVLRSLLSDVDLPPTMAIEIDLFSRFPPLDFSHWFDEASPKPSKNCQITHLTITDCTMTAGIFNKLLQVFQSLPNLKKLKLCSLKGQADSSLSCTEAVVGLLKTPKLHHLSLSGHLEVDVKKLSEALQESKTSTAFVQCTPKGMETPIKEIAYCSALNHHGCAQLSAPDANLALLVDCLGSVHGCYKEGGTLAAIPNLEESVLYGLLHEAPGLWAHSAANKKRPACARIEQAKMAKKQKQGG